MIRALCALVLRIRLRLAQFDLDCAMCDVVDAEERVLHHTRKAAAIQRKCLQLDVPALRGVRGHA